MCFISKRPYYIFVSVFICITVSLLRPVFAVELHSSESDKILRELPSAVNPSGLSPAYTKRSIPANQIKVPPIIDGTLDDPCWHNVNQATDFSDEFYGNLVTDQTTVYVGYDRRYIYIGFQAHDSHPSGIVAHQTKRGSTLSGDDTFTFTINTFGSHKGDDNSTFSINPLGTQLAQLAAGRGQKLEWEGAWKSAAKIDSDGWSGEIMIPWSILNYPSRSKITSCGINFARFQARTKITSWWSNIGINKSFDLEGTWLGVKFPDFVPRISILPYLLLGMGERKT